LNGEKEKNKSLRKKIGCRSIGQLIIMRATRQEASQMKELPREEELCRCICQGEIGQRKNTRMLNLLFYSSAQNRHPYFS
jgi:hypothetical protein